eukprot:TRINITY_DN91196_c0_g1_i1.p3 TRINITY_DN91196_c0_g1~~TRINITY_DN91196_c0_g1_i1.p3  ORF type:complete len:110 (+),score=16.99 TRINITY_DN91196_c0_g1_i1:75-404(+)
MAGSSSRLTALLVLVVGAAVFANTMKTAFVSAPATAPATRSQQSLRGDSVSAVAAGVAAASVALPAHAIMLPGVNLEVPDELAIFVILIFSTILIREFLIAYNKFLGYM